jgi:hypothetical protein
LDKGPRARARRNPPASPGLQTSTLVFRPGFRFDVRAEQGERRRDERCEVHVGSLPVPRPRAGLPDRSPLRADEGGVPDRSGEEPSGLRETLRFPSRLALTEYAGPRLPCHGD